MKKLLVLLAIVVAFAFAQPATAFGEYGGFGKHGNYHGNHGNYHGNHNYGHVRYYGNWAPYSYSYVPYRYEYRAIPNYYYAPEPAPYYYRPSLGLHFGIGSGGRWHFGIGD